MNYLKELYVPYAFFFSSVHSSTLDSAVGVEDQHHVSKSAVNFISSNVLDMDDSYGNVHIVFVTTSNKEVFLQDFLDIL